jgi:LPXTG-motif cell wall-anchored protein
MYYEKGWKASIDEKETEILRVNYVLRGLQIPAGKHVITFKFEPQVIQTGSTITLFSFIGMLVLLMGGIYFEQRKKNQE